MQVYVEPFFCFGDLRLLSIRSSLILLGDVTFKLKIQIAKTYTRTKSRIKSTGHYPKTENQS